MTLGFDWRGRSERERIAEIRWRCYGSRGGTRERFGAEVTTARMEDGDVLIASADGQDVGTATSLSMHMHIRGKRVPCQGVAWVGTSKSHRRRAGSEGSKNERGIASQIMEKVVAKGRERGQSVSALMPFRTSFYEHFGYGLVEYQNIWTIPLELLPQAPTDGWRFGAASDKPAMVACRARQATAGHCDVETSAAGIDEWFQSLADSTQLFVQTDGDKIGAYAWVKTVDESDLSDGSDRLIAHILQPSWDSPAALLSLLAMIGSLRDQYAAVRIVLPTDVPLNWLLREHQVPHRNVQHPAAACKVISRMQARIIDPVKFLTGQKLSRPVTGGAIVGVRESEGDAHTYELSASDGVIECKPSARSADIELTDVLFAAIMCGSLRASAAQQCGLVSARAAPAIAWLDALADGPAGFSFEYF
ncbi:MAG: GNAT family N-acetyltransferase [Burkholderiales bacterium]|nr:GNAT family N-acetyltransferase [Phycisphaerae bacterium]